MRTRYVYLVESPIGEIMGAFQTKKKAQEVANLLCDYEITYTVLRFEIGSVNKGVKV